MRTNATINELQKALAIVNRKYDNNICFKRIMTTSTARTRFTLTVKDSRGAGSRKTQTGRRVSAACWHVHGNFFDALFGLRGDIFVSAHDRRIDKYQGNWQDAIHGYDNDRPVYYSSLCDC